MGFVKELLGFFVLIVVNVKFVTGVLVQSKWSKELWLNGCGNGCDWGLGFSDLGFSDFEGCLEGCLSQLVNRTKDRILGMFSEEFRIEGNHINLLLGHGQLLGGDVVGGDMVVELR